LIQPLIETLVVCGLVLGGALYGRRHFDQADPLTRLFSIIIVGWVFFLHARLTAMFQKRYVGLSREHSEPALWFSYVLGYGIMAVGALIFFFVIPVKN
jgi:hypothetical protein